MIRLFEFRDLDRIMEIWLEGNLKAHPFIKEEYWRQNYEIVRSVLPNAEVYVFEEDGEAYDPEEEAFRRQMQRKKKRKGIRR